MSAPTGPGDADDPGERPTSPAEPPGGPDVGVDAPPSGLVVTDVRERVVDPAVEDPAALAADAAERRALVVGEALVDVVHRADGSVDEHPGGSPANVALGLGRLGRGVDLLTWIGPDERGRRVTDHLASSNVAVVPGSAGAERTSVAVARLDADGAATYEFDLTWRVPDRWTAPPGAPLVVHTGSVAALVEPGAADVLRIVRAHRGSATVTYDPNLRPSLVPPRERTRPVVETFVRLADVVKTSDEDLEWLAPGEHPLDVARRWARWGPAAVVVTRGGQGATAVTASGHEVDVAAPPVRVADTVGAGDSFMGALLDGLWSANLLGADQREALHAADARTWERVLVRCARVAAITVSRPGADPPRAAELD